MYHQASDGVETVYGGHLTARMLDSTHEHAHVQVWATPTRSALEVPPKCRALWDAADAARLTWTLRQHMTDDNEQITALEVYGLLSPTDNGTHFSWVDDVLITSGPRRMSLRKAHARINDLSPAR